MYKTIVCALVLLASAVCLPSQAVAQDNNKQTTVQGCLQVRGGRYSIKGDDGMVYKLTGEANKLKDHVGHEVAVTGTPTVRTYSTTEQGAASTVKEQHVIRVMEIKPIADACTAPAK